MDKNLTAFIREDTKTIGVRFFQEPWNKRGDDVNMTLIGVEDVNIPLSNKEYTYITDLNLQVEDLVIVYACNIPKIAFVSRVDEGLGINPKDNIEYRWVIGKVDFSHYLANAKRNQEINELIKTAYRKNVKEQFKDLILAGLDAKNKKALTNLIKG